MSEERDRLVEAVRDAYRRKVELRRMGIKAHERLVEARQAVTAYDAAHTTGRKEEQ